MQNTSPTRRALPALAGSRVQSRGFTLTELLVAIGIIAILVSVGIPSYKNVTTANRMSAEINGLLYDMQYARSEAIKQGTPVTVCASWDGQTCLGWVWWGAGWIVFEDKNGNQSVDPGEAVLRSQPALASGDSLWPDNWFYAVTYNREGYALGMPGTVTLHLHDANWNNVITRCLQISLVGQMQTERFGFGNCWW
ncbi:MAG TPA: Tfp pilus assembly protein FimT/FimU [Steroidobacteraceae bacterium]|nr:Tfp pilus assembly protein FimT/FimU [Steroidobacteraceae bacterium]